MEDELRELKMLCDAELKIQNLNDDYSITEEDLREQILTEFLEQKVFSVPNVSEDCRMRGLRVLAERLVERIVERKRYYGLVKKEEVA